MLALLNKWISFFDESAFPLLVELLLVTAYLLYIKSFSVMYNVTHTQTPLCLIVVIPGGLVEFHISRMCVCVCLFFLNILFIQPVLVIHSKISMLFSDSHNNLCDEKESIFLTYTQIS